MAAKHSAGDSVNIESLIPEPVLAGRSRGLALALALPEFIARGLAANDRVTYYLALLQAAQTHAQSPEQPASNLRLERESSGITDVSLDRIVEESFSRGSGTTYIPAGCAILESLFDALRHMHAAIDAAGAARPELCERAALYARRLDALTTTARRCKDDQMTMATIADLTSLTRNGHDTVHQLIMDMHGELDALLSTTAIETIDGAHVLGATEADRVLIRAFMSGIHETAALKFGHPGLETTVAREGSRLSIQNDLGSTPSHLVVIHVEELVATITYSDIHRSRLRFFQRLLDAYSVVWSPSAAPEPGGFEMAVGTYTGIVSGDIERFLRLLGSRLVFLIDWNRARKRLSRLVNKATALEVLRWAADNNVGHRGFLEAGGVRLIDTAFERAVPRHTRLGVRLDELLNPQSARLFLMSVLRSASWGLSTKQSLRLIEDKVEAELLRYLQTPNRHILAGVAQHSTTIAALAGRVREEFLHRRSNEGRRGDEPRTSELARAWTTRADTILEQERRFVRGREDARELTALLGEAASALAALEETAFTLTLIPAGVDAAALSLVEGLAEQVDAIAREYVRCLEEGQDVSPTSDRVDVDNFLVTIDRLIALGRDVNRAKRALTERLLQGLGDCRELYVLTMMADGFERTASSLSRCASIVRDEVLRTRLPR